MAKIMFLFQITNLFTKKQTGTLDRSCHSGYEKCMPENKKESSESKMLTRGLGGREGD